MATLPELLKSLVDMNGSDLHIATATPPQVRVNGRLERLQLPELSPAETKQLVYSVLTDSQKKRFEETMELDFSFGIKAIGDELKELILVGASGMELRRKAVEEGMLTLRMSGLRKVKDGLTSLEEVVRETVK